MKRAGYFIRPFSIVTFITKLVQALNLLLKKKIHGIRSPQT